jgi:arginyl-tRNA synthetase
MCGYLFELASTFTGFYENCPVLGAPDPRTRASRLALCALTATVLEKGLELLGIEAPERM